MLIIFNSRFQSESLPLFSRSLLDLLSMTYFFLHPSPASTSVLFFKKMTPTSEFHLDCLQEHGPLTRGHTTEENANLQQLLTAY